MASEYIFSTSNTKLMVFPVETAGAWCQETKNRIDEIGLSIIQISEDKGAKSHLKSQPGSSKKERLWFCL